LYLYCPDLLYPYQVLYSHYTLPRKLPFSGQCERLSRRLVINKKAIVYWYTMRQNIQQRTKMVLVIQTVHHI
jgi:hypothetical protein